jgi:N4-gp56 family major capsid protein
MAVAWADVEAGLLGNPELSTTVRAVAWKQTRLGALVTPGDDLYLGRKSGDTIGFRLMGRIPGLADTPLNEFQKIPMAKPPSYEATAIVYRRGLAVPWTGLREDLDRLDVEAPIMWALRENSARTHNKLIYDALVAGRSFTYVATGAATNVVKTDGTVADNSAAAFSAWHARRVRLVMSKYNVPFADGENYLSVISPTMYTNLFDDVGTNGFVDVKKYADGGAEGIMDGEVGSYMGTRYVVDNNTDILPDAVGTGSAFGTGFFAGLDACREVVVYPMELYANMNLSGDFGQQKAVAWLSLLTYKTVWMYATHGQGAVLHYTSLT